MTAGDPIRMRLLLVDDERMLLTYLVRALQRLRPDWVVETAGDGLEALGRLKPALPDLLVTDVQMPGMDGMALLTQIRRDPAMARMPLILISAQDDRTSLRQGMCSGADDYLTKPFTAEELVQAAESRMKRLRQGGDVNAEPDLLKAELSASLTARELEVLSLIGQGLVTKDIAAALKVSPKTVSAHRQSIMGKLDLHNAAALAALAIRASLG